MTAEHVPAWEQALPEAVKHRLWRLRDMAGHRLREYALRPPRFAAKARREELAIRYLRGDGIEIGALDWPLTLPHTARARYVDHAPADELRELYAVELSMNGRELVEPDVVDEAEKLAKFSDESLDFVIANHMLEHTEDPIAALHTFVRVLRPGGVLFLTLPDARHTFDAPRARTTIEHLLTDHRDGGQASRHEHFVECAHLIEGAPQELAEQRAREMQADGWRIHFHVWELETFLALLLALELPLDIECAQTVADEFTLILRRRAAQAG